VLCSCFGDRRPGNSGQNAELLVLPFFVSHAARLTRAGIIRQNRWYGTALTERVRLRAHRKEGLVARDVQKHNSPVTFVQSGKGRGCC
jgi:hypothetical protein